MSSEWYYVRGGERSGPCVLVEVRSLLSSGAMPPDTLVWSPGMLGWEPASGTPAFRDVCVRAAAPPPVPTVSGQPGEGMEPAYASSVTTDAWLSTDATGRSAPSGPGGEAADSANAAVAVHPWHRWIARILDLFVFGFALGILVEAVAPGTLDAVDDKLLTLIIFAAWVPVEAFMLAEFGTTLGRALLRIRVTSRAGGSLSLAVALNRSFQVWMRGLAFGLPGVPLVTQIVAYNRLSREGSTSWDSELDLRVAHEPVGAARWICVALIFAFMLYCVIIATP